MPTVSEFIGLLGKRIPAIARHEPAYQACVEALRKHPSNQEIPLEPETPLGAAASILGFVVAYFNGPLQKGNLRTLREIFHCVALMLQDADKPGTYLDVLEGTVLPTFGGQCDVERRESSEKVSQLLNVEAMGLTESELQTFRSDDVPTMTRFQRMNSWVKRCGGAQALHGDVRQWASEYRAAILFSALIDVTHKAIAATKTKIGEEPEALREEAGCSSPVRRSASVPLEKARRPRRPFSAWGRRKRHRHSHSHSDPALSETKSQRRGIGGFWKGVKKRIGLGKTSTATVAPAEAPTGSATEPAHRDARR